MSPSPEWYEPADVIEEPAEVLADVPHEDLSVVNGICAWSSLHAADDDAND